MTIPAGEDTGTPLPGFNFHVAFRPMGGGFAPMESVAPEVTGAFSEVSGLEATMEPRAIKEGGRNYGAVMRAGPVSFGTVILKRGIALPRHLWAWWTLFAGADGAANGAWGPQARAEVAISLLRGRDVAMTWRLENAMPIKYRAADLSARGTEVAIEELHLAHEGFHMEAA